MSRETRCRCAQKCERGCSWLARAQMADCAPSAQSCACWCHAFAAECAESRERAYQAGYRWKYEPETRGARQPS